MKKTTVLFALILSFFISSGCSHLTRKQIERIEDKNFTFSGFYYSHLGSDEEKAFLFYKEFPVKKLMYLLANEYGLVIDITEYQKFIIHESIDEIKVQRGFRKEHFSWHSGFSEGSRIEIRMKKDYFDIEEPEIKITLHSGRKTVQIIDSPISNYDSMFRRINSLLPSSKDAGERYDKMNYHDKNPLAGLVQYLPDITQSEESGDDKKTKIKDMIKNYSEGLSNDDKSRFRHEMLDFIYKITE